MRYQLAQLLLIASLLVDKGPASEWASTQMIDIFKEAWEESSARRENLTSKLVALEKKSRDLRNRSRA